MSRSLAELQLRLAFCRECIKTISAVDPSDPRRAGALAEYNRQLAVISAQITEITGQPPPITIGLKPAKLFFETEGVKHE